MKGFIIALLVWFLYSPAIAQSNPIELGDLGVLGIVFDQSYEPYFVLNGATDRFTPSIADIKNAEKLVSYFNVEGRALSKKRRRQYLGFKRGVTCYLLVNVLYFKSEKQFSRDFPKWKSSFSYLLSEPDDIQKSYLYMVNLDDNTIGFFQ